EVQTFEDEKPLSGAEIVLINTKEESKRYEVDAAANGKFVIPNVEPGEYEVTVSGPGMLSQSSKIKVAAGETKGLSVKLSEVETADVLRITGKRTLIHPEKIGSATNVDKTFL